MSTVDPLDVEDFDPCHRLEPELAEHISALFELELPPGMLGPPIPLGGGGQGRVVQVRDELGRRYAFKRLSRETEAERAEIQRRRLSSEIEALGAFDHPQVARLISADAERLWLLSEYIAGPTLSERLALPQSLLEPAGRPLSREEALRLSLALAQTLEELHRRGFAHRDLKPSNIILRNANLEDPVIVDFGIACELSPAASDYTGLMPHTPGRCNPNVASKSEAWRHDIYALGLVLGEALSGQFLLRIPSLGPESLGGAESARLIARALELAGAPRYNSMSEFRAELQSLQRPKRPSSRALAFLAGLALALGLALNAPWISRPAAQADQGAEPPGPRPSTEQSTRPPAGARQVASALRGCRFKPSASASGAFALEVLARPKMMDGELQDLQVGDKITKIRNQEYPDSQAFIAALVAVQSEGEASLELERCEQVFTRRARLMPCLSIRGDLNARLSLRKGSTDIYELRGITRVPGSGNEILSETDHVRLINGLSSADPACRSAFESFRVGEACVLSLSAHGGPLIKIVRFGSDELLETVRLELGSWRDARGRNLPKWSFLDSNGERTIMSATEPSLPETNCVTVLYDAVDREGYHIAAPLPRGSLLLQKLKNQQKRSLVSAYRMDDNPNFAGQTEWRFRSDPALGERLSGKPHELFYEAARELNFQLVDQYTKHYSYQIVDPERVEVISIPAKNREDYESKVALRLQDLDPSFQPISFTWELQP